MSVNQISKGLVWHHDFVLQNQPDDCLTSPGMTFVIHLGKDHEDVVYVEYKHDLSRRTVCTPGTAYVFPGGCFKHRTVREYNITSNHKVLDLTDRFSLVTFLNFKKAKAREIEEAKAKAAAEGQNDGGGEDAATEVKGKAAGKKGKKGGKSALVGEIKRR